MTDAQDFVAYLERAIKAAGVSPSDLARAAGVPDSAISRWRRGKAIPSMDSLRAIAPTLRVEPMELFVVAGHVLPGEAGMTEMPEPPGPPPTPEEEIMAQTWLSDRGKEAMITFLNELVADYKTGGGRSPQDDGKRRA